METEYSVYLGQEQKNGFTGFLSEKNFFCIVEIFDGYTQEQGEMLLSSLSAVSTIEQQSLMSFDSFISDCLKHANVPLDTSLAAGYIKGDVMYLKTIETGEVYLQRKHAFERLIAGTTTASGKFSKGDLFIFTSAFFTESLKGLQIIKTHLHKNPSLPTLSEDLKSTIGQQDDTGAVSLFVRMNEEGIKKEKKDSLYFQRVGTFFKSMPGMIAQSRKKMAITAGIILCAGLLGWNIVGRINTQGGINPNGVKSFEEQKQTIESKIETAKSQKDTLKTGLETLSGAQLLLGEVKKSASKDKQKTVDELTKQITDTESFLLNREYKTAKEFSDFSLEEKNAKGTKVSLFEDGISVLNPDGKVYQLSLTTKAMEKRKLSASVSGTSLVAPYEKVIYVLDPLQGIVRIGEDNTIKKIIPKDEGWKSIQEMRVFNGNIYLLDGGAGDIYKYPVIEGGFGDKTSYFKGSYDLIDEKSSFAIDSAVYVSQASSVSKYNAGLKIDFAFEAPQSSFEITKIIAEKDVEEMYVWDKKKGIIYSFSKEGVYKKQVVNKELSQGDDVIVYKSKAYVLKGAKLFEIEL